ncbi:MAG: hypothetical protein ACTSQK_03930 [Candidatus Heimdallarchaeota archaeon]
MALIYDYHKNPSTFHDEINDNYLGIDEYWTINSFHIGEDHTLSYRLKTLDFNAKLYIYIADSNQVIMNNGSYEILNSIYINLLMNNNYLSDTWKPLEIDHWQFIIVNKGYSTIRFNIEIEVQEDYSQNFVAFVDWLKSWSEIVLGPVIVIASIIIGLNKIEKWASKKLIVPYENQPAIKIMITDKMK